MSPWRVSVERSRATIAQLLALSLSAGDTGLDTAAFLLGDSRTDVSDELSSPIGTNLFEYLSKSTTYMCIESHIRS